MDSEIAKLAKSRGVSTLTLESKIEEKRREKIAEIGALNDSKHSREQVYYKFHPEIEEYAAHQAGVELGLLQE